MTNETRQPVICASCGWTGKRKPGTSPCIAPTAALWPRVVND